MSIHLHFLPAPVLSSYQSFYAILPLPSDLHPHACLRVVAIKDAAISQRLLLCAVHFSPSSNTLPPTPETWQQNSSLLHPLTSSIHAYLQGELVDWDIEVIMPDIPFKQKAWKAMAEIPYGTTISYSELAARAGNPKAIRAAASACATNPIPLVIPCHRIVAKDGGLGGFAWGLPYKQSLLDLESRTISPYIDPPLQQRRA